MAAGRLTAAQSAAIEHVRALAAAAAAGDPAIAPQRPVTINFHPDRVAASGRTVADELLADGRYRSQFETGISNGGRTAFPGGDRDRWERRMFGGAYHRAGVEPGERPKYGAWDLMGHPDGASPRFGSCHLRLRAAVTARCTFSLGDSITQPEHVGTVDTAGPLLAALLAQVARTGVALGVPGVTAAELAVRLRGPARARAEHGRAIDDYVEAQAHGDLVLGRDVDTIVADPSFHGTATGAVLERVGRAHGVALAWHAGFALPIDDAVAAAAGFRGAAAADTACRIGRDLGVDVLDAAAIGEAAARWPDRDADETLQRLKQVWHVLVRFGAPTG